MRFSSSRSSAGGRLGLIGRTVALAADGDIQQRRFRPALKSNADARGRADAGARQAALPILSDTAHQTAEGKSAEVGADDGRCIRVARRMTRPTPRRLSMSWSITRAGCRAWRRCRPSERDRAPRCRPAPPVSMWRERVPALRKPSWASAEFRMAMISRFNRATTSAGVPLGAKKPYHMSTSASSSPLSPSVGTSGSCGRRSRTTDGERLQLAGLDVGCTPRARAGTCSRPGRRQEILHRAGRTLVGDMQQLDAGRGLQQRHRQMMRRADAGAGVGQRLRIDPWPARSSPRALPAFWRGMSNQHQRAPATQAQRGEIGHRVIGQVAEQAGIHDQRVDRRHDRAGHRALPRATCRLPMLPEAPGSILDRPRVGRAWGTGARPRNGR